MSYRRAWQLVEALNGVPRAGDHDRDRRHARRRRAGDRVRPAHGAAFPRAWRTRRPRPSRGAETLRRTPAQAQTAYLARYIPWYIARSRGSQPGRSAGRGHAGRCVRLRLGRSRRRVGLYRGDGPRRHRAAGDAAGRAASQRCRVVDRDIQVHRAGHFHWRLFWPFAVVSIPMAFVGGAITLPGQAYKILVGVVLLYAAWQLWRSARAGEEMRTVREPPLARAMAIGAAMGLLAGLTGVGGGIFLSPLLLMLGWAGTKQTSAVAAPFILVNSLAGLAAGFAARSGVRCPSIMDSRARGPRRRLVRRRIRQPALRQSAGAPDSRRGAGGRRRQDGSGVDSPHEDVRLRRLVGQRQDHADREADPALRRARPARVAASSTRTTPSTSTSRARIPTATATRARARCWSPRRGAGC